jgi:hypothetical protein
MEFESDQNEAASPSKGWNPFERVIEWKGSIPINS